MSWLRDPLLHFAVIGLILFAGYGVLDGADSNSSDTIRLDTGDLAALRSGWTQQWGRAPTPEELEGLVEDHVRQEILYREALALGLDRGDTIVRRRMAQKMEFLATDSARIAEPTDADLEGFLSENAERFEVPGSLSFQQIYFGRDRHGDRVAEVAADALTTLQRDEGVDPSSLGDRFLLPAEQRGLTDDRVAQVFGEEFQQAIQKLPVGSWAGPVRSGYGYHVVMLEAFVSRRPARLSDVREEVAREWEAAERQVANQAFYRDLRERYRIEVANFEPAPAPREP